MKNFQQDYSKIYLDLRLAAVNEYKISSRKKKETCVKLFNK